MMIIRASPAAALIVAGVLTVGCTSDKPANPSMKREQDRVAMQLDDAQRERNELRAKMEKMRADMAEADKRNDQTRAQLEEANAKLKKATDDLALARANQTGAVQTAAQVKSAQADSQALQAKLDEMSKRAADLSRQNEELQRKLQNGAFAGNGSATRPASAADLNK